MDRLMKDSGVEWIGEIPEHWKICKLKNVATIQTGNTPTKNEQDTFYSDEEGIPWIKAEDLGSNIAITKTKEYLTIEGAKQGRIFAPNTVFVCCIASIGKTGFSQIECSCNQQINGVYFNKMFWKYGYYMTLAQEVEYLLNASGNVMKILNTDKQSKLICPFPPQKEQQKIADFLDEKVGEIDKVIETTKATIEDYKNYKQSLITEAVTKGIYNDICKQTGNIHIPEIPENWEMKKMKYIFYIKKDIAGEEGYDILSITQKGIKVKDITSNEGQLAADYSKYQLVNAGDFAMNHMDLLTGWVDVSAFNGVTSPDYRVFNFINEEGYNRRYYLYLMQMCYMDKIFYGLGQGVSNLGRWRLQADKFLNFRVPVPSESEQEEIANYLDEKCIEIDNLISAKEQLVEDMESYKKSLIYEYVTGKKEVE